jgi:hypothetical protein
MEPPRLSTAAFEREEHFDPKGNRRYRRVKVGNGPVLLAVILLFIFAASIGVRIPPVFWQFFKWW